MKKTLILVAALGVVGVANAQIFTNSAAFQAAIANDAGQFNNAFGSATANWSGGTPTMAYTVSTTGGLYSNGNFIGTNNPNVPLVITFTSGNVRAVGGEFFATDISDNFLANVPLTITYSDGTVDTYTPGGFGTFRGYVSGTILTSMSIDSVAPPTNRYVSMDNVITSAVPEPATMTALALGAAAMLRRRNKKA